MTETNQTVTKTQEEFFRELGALRHVADLAQQAVEAKMQEMAAGLGHTFLNEGHGDHPEAKVLQIRVRFNKERDRKVPFFVPLKGFPKEWLGKKETTAPVVVAETAAAESAPEILG